MQLEQELLNITKKGNWDSVPDILENLKDKIDRYFKFDVQSEKKKKMLALQQQDMDVYSAGKIITVNYRLHIVPYIIQIC